MYVVYVCVCVCSWVRVGGGLSPDVAERKVVVSLRVEGRWHEVCMGCALCICVWGMYRFKGMHGVCTLYGVCMGAMGVYAYKVSKGMYECKGGGGGKGVHSARGCMGAMVCMGV